jgi:hypothetical protein
MSYDPALGRFLERDPIGYDDGMNPYQFVGDNPMGRVDPLGLAGQSTTTPTRRPATGPTTGPVVPTAPFDNLDDLIKRWEYSKGNPAMQKWLMEKIEEERKKHLDGIGRGNVEFKNFDGERAKYLQYFKIIPEHGTNFTTPRADGVYKDIDGVVLPNYDEGFWLKVPDDAAARIIYICIDGKAGYEVQNIAGEVSVTYEAHDGVKGSRGPRGTGRTGVWPVLRVEFEE